MSFVVREERERRVRQMYYVDGSTVRRTQYQAVPERRRRPQQPARRPKRTPENVTYPKAAARAERSLYFDRGYMMVLGIALLVMIISCVVMLTLQSKVSNQERNIHSMQEEIQDMEANNAAYSDLLESKYSLDKVYTVATKELGMVYSQKGQIVYYESANEDYVKQLKDVPEAN
ncbi:MAG: hypothetical protein IKI86_08265 [Firmicutes bacterium]|nr:hypothetical protein [Bacillota bacterium]